MAATANRTAAAPSVLERFEAQGAQPRTLKKCITSGNLAQSAHQPALFCQRHSAVAGVHVLLTGPAKPLYGDALRSGPAWLCLRDRLGMCGADAAEFEVKIESVGVAGSTISNAATEGAEIGCAFNDHIRRELHHLAHACSSELHLVPQQRGDLKNPGVVGAARRRRGSGRPQRAASPCTSARSPHRPDGDPKPHTHAHMAHVNAHRHGSTHTHTPQHVVLLRSSLGFATTGAGGSGGSGRRRTRRSRSSDSRSTGGTRSSSSYTTSSSSSASAAGARADREATPSNRPRTVALWLRKTDVLRVP